MPAPEIIKEGGVFALALTGGLEFVKMIVAAVRRRRKSTIDLYDSFLGTLTTRVAALEMQIMDRDRAHWNELQTFRKDAADERRRLEDETEQCEKERRELVAKIREMEEEVWEVKTRLKRLSDPQSE